jgi:16S rRNA processing protein RimM
MSTSSKNNTADDGDRISDGNADKIVIGYVACAHGVKGEVRVVPLTDFPERFRQMDHLDLYSNNRFVRTLHITRVREHEGKGEFILESDITDRNEAEKLAGMSVLIDREERVPLPEGSFWVDDLIGLSVLDGDGNILGVVANLISSGGNEVYEIKDAQGDLHYIPAVEEFVKAIDLESGTIVVQLIEGLWG